MFWGEFQVSLLGVIPVSVHKLIQWFPLISLGFPVVSLWCPVVFSGSQWLSVVSSTSTPIQERLHAEDPTGAASDSAAQGSEMVARLFCWSYSPVGCFF